jgi:hypothetical protein
MFPYRRWSGLLSSFVGRRAKHKELRRDAKHRPLRVEPLEERQLLTVSAPDGIGLYNPVNSNFDLRHTNTTGNADLSFGYGQGNDGWKAVMGDWNGDCVDTAGLYDPTSASFFNLRNSNSAGYADIQVAFGQPDAGWIPIAGDWDGVGGGVDTIGLYEPSTGTYYLRNSNTTGTADATFFFGAANWQPLAGDWNGDGIDSIGGWYPPDGSFYLRNSNSYGNTDIYVTIVGAPTTNVKAIAGDWNGDGIYSVGLYHIPTATFYLKNTNAWGPADYVFSYGNLNDTRQPIAGHWANWYPTANANTYSVTEDNVLTVSAPGVLGNDADPEGQAMTAELVSSVSPSQGTLSLNSNGSFTYTPAANFYGTASFTYRTSPGQVEVNPRTATVSINVNNVPDPPTLTSISTLNGSVEDNPTTITYAALAAAANEADSDSPTISFRVEGVSSGTLTKNGSAVSPGTTLLGPGEQLVWTPAANANGTLAAFSVKAWDGALVSTTAAVQVNVSVAAVNDPPTLDPIANPSPIGEDAPEQAFHDWGITAGGGESQQISVTATSSNTAIIPHPRVEYTYPNSYAWFFYTPVPNAYGTAVITVTVRDSGLDLILGNGDDATAQRQVTVTVNPGIDPPTLNPIGNPPAINEDAGTQTVSLSGIYPPPFDPPLLAVYASSDNTALIPNPTVNYTSPNSTGSLTYTPVANQSGTATITVTARSGGANGVLGGGDDGWLYRTFTVTVNPVNDLPTMDAISSPPAIWEDAPQQAINVAGITAGGGESQSLQVTASSSNTSLIPTPTVIDYSYNGNAWIQYTPVANQSGTAVITVTVRDAGLDLTLGNGDDGTFQRTFTVTVQAVNDTPTLDAIANPAAINEDAGQQQINLSGISAGGGEPQALKILVSSSNTTLIPTPTVSYTSPNATGAIYYTPAANKNGTAEITVTVEDAGLNGALDGVDDGWLSRTFTVVVNSVNDAPILDNTGTTSLPTMERNPVTNSGITIGALVASAGGDRITDADPADLEGIAVLGVDNSHGTWQYSLDGGANWSDFGTPSTTVARLLAADVNTRIRLVPTTDWYGSLAAGLTFKAWDRTAGTSGGAADATSSGGATPFSTATETAAARVNAVPTLTSVATLTGAQEDAAFSIPYQTLADAADEADLDDSTVTFRVESVLNGTLTKNGQPVVAGSTTLAPGEQWSWTPTANGNGTFAGFTVKAGDPLVWSASPVSVSIAVAAMNDAPIRTTGTVANLTVLEDAAITTLGLGSIAYGPGGGTDEAGQSLTYHVTSVPNASLGQVLLADGTTPVAVGSYSLAEIRGMQFRPAADANGSAAFSFQVQDDGGTPGSDTLTETLTITVTPVNDAPSFTVGASQSVNEDCGPQTVAGWATAISAGPANESAQALDFVVTTNESGLFAAGPAINPTTGTLTYTPAANANGIAHVNVSLHDNGGGADTSATQSFLIVVSTINDLPTISTIANQTINEDGSVGPLALNISDVETPAGELRLSAVSSNPAVVPSASVVIGGSGANRSVTITPPANAFGTSTITLTVTDGFNTTSTTSFAVTVNSVNDLPAISQLPRAVAPYNGNTGALSFTLGDVETGVGQLTLSASSSNAALVPTDNIVLGGSGSARTVTVTPASNVGGEVTITLTATDANGGQTQMAFPVTIGSINAQVALYESANHATFYFLNTNTASTAADYSAGFGDINEGCKPVLGDWNNDGLDTIGVYDPLYGTFAVSDFWLSNANETSEGTSAIAFGSSEFASRRIPIAGDWSWPAIPEQNSPAVSPDGTDTLGLYDPVTSTFYLRNVNQTGTADREFGYGSPNSGWSAVAGDWDGNGSDTIGGFDPSARCFYLANINQMRIADLTVGISDIPSNTPAASLRPVAGDWDGDGVDEVGIFDNITYTFYLKYSNVSGAADLVFSFNPADHAHTYYPVGGRWNARPTISAIADQQTNEDTSLSNVAFTIGDGQSTSDQLTLTATSSNETIVPSANITLGGSGANRTVSITPAANQSGTVTITLTATDHQGGTATEEFFLTVNPMDDPLTISAIAHQYLTKNRPSQPIRFMLADPDVQPHLLSVTVTGSSNPSLISTADVSVSGNESERYLSITPTADMVGDATLELTVTNQATGAVATTSFATSVGAVASMPGLYNPHNSHFLLHTSLSTGVAEIEAGFGAPNTGWVPLTADWNDDGKDTIGLFAPDQGLVFYLRNDNTTGVADVTFGYGAQGWLPIVGDWNGDGTSTIGMYDPTTSVFYLRNSNSAGYADRTFGFGAPGAGWLPIAGDWNGDGIDTIGLYDPASSTFYLHNSNDSGYAEMIAGFGAPGAGWLPLVGDWDGNLSDTIGLYDPGNSLFLLRNSNTAGYADAIFGFGEPGGGWLPVAGDWDGRGVSPPSAVMLSPQSVVENGIAPVLVGTLSTTDPDGNGPFTYTLVPGEGDTNNNSFRVQGDQLWTTALLDHEAFGGTYRIRVMSTDRSGRSGTSIIPVQVTNTNEPPVAMGLNNVSIAENQAIGSRVGEFTTLDRDQGGSFTYSLVPGTGSSDNASFQIVDNQLRTAASFNYEAKSTYQIRVRTADQGGLYYEKAFTITVTDGSDPLMAPTKVSAQILSPREISVTWNDNSTGVTQYDIERATSSDGPWTVISVGTSPWSKVDVVPSTEAGWSHYYRVRGVFGSAGVYYATSEYSSVVEATAFAGPARVDTRNTWSNTITVSWDPAPSATTYEIYRWTSMSDLSWDDPAAWVSVGSFGAQTSIPMVNLQIGATYGFAVACVNTAGSTITTSTMTKSNPTQVLALGDDEDHDGLTNDDEWRRGTDPLKTDSDGDLLPDAWEIQYGLDPTRADPNGNGITDAEEDADGDGLNNLGEHDSGSSPTAQDTDSDGVPDAIEAVQGGNPADAADGGQALPIDMRGTFRLKVGDPSSSQSELWSITVGDKTYTAPDYNYSSETYYHDYPFRAGNSYDITLQHLGTEPEYLTEMGGPNYDWTASVDRVQGEVEYWIDDPYSTAPVVNGEGGDQYKLLQEHIWDVIGPPNLTAGKTARLHIFELDADVDSANDSGFSVPTDNIAEDRLEIDSTTGKLVWPNVGDLDHNGQPDYQDLGAIPGLKFVPMALRLSPNISQANATEINVSITYNSSLIRVWKPGMDGSVARTSGDIVSSGASISASRLGLSPGGPAVVLFVEALPGASGSLAIDVAAEITGSKWSGTLTDKVYVMAAEINLDASPNSSEATEETPGTPLLLNDDWDCLQTYQTTSGGHREEEPLWDKDYTAAQVATEDDLMRVRLNVTPVLTGNATLTIASGAANVRLWPRATKGTSSEIITIPSGGLTYTISTLPQDIYVEGIALGRTVMKLEYTVDATTFSDTLNIDVVMLRESQGNDRKVINDYNSDISFVVMSDKALSSQYVCHWDLDGDGTRSGGAWESDTTVNTSVKYSGNPSGVGNVNLPVNAANRRKTYDCSVMITSAGLPSGLVIHRSIRVALDSYAGTNVATTEAERRTEVAGLTTPPQGFANTPASGDCSQAWFESNYGVEVSPPGLAINNGNRLQYSTDTGAYGLTPYTGAGASRSVYAVMVLKAAYDAGFKREDLQSVAVHECRHAAQHIAVAAGGNNWRTVDGYYTQASGYSRLREADAERVELGANGSWHYLRENSLFRTAYDGALADYSAMSSGTGKNAAKAILQSIYTDIAFLEMKIAGYDWYVRPPE